MVTLTALNSAKIVFPDFSREIAFIRQNVAGSAARSGWLESCQVGREMQVSILEMQGKIWRIQKSEGQIFNIILHPSTYKFQIK